MVGQEDHLVKHRHCYEKSSKKMVWGTKKLRKIDFGIFAGVFSLKLRGVLSSDWMYSECKFKCQEQSSSPKQGKTSADLFESLKTTLAREQGRCKRETWRMLAMSLRQRLSNNFGQDKTSIVSKYCFSREFAMTVLPEHHLGNMSMQQHMALIIKLVLVSQDEARAKDQMFA